MNECEEIVNTQWRSDRPQFVSLRYGFALFKYFLQIIRPILKWLSINCLIYIDIFIVFINQNLISKSAIKALHSNSVFFCLIGSISLKKRLSFKNRPYLLLLFMIAPHKIENIWFVIKIMKFKLKFYAKQASWSVIGWVIMDEKKKKRS